MFREQTIENVKEEAAGLGRNLGILLASADFPQNVKEAALTLLPYADLADMRVGQANFDTRLQKLRRISVNGKLRGTFDDSISELLVREILLRGALEAASFRLYGFEQQVRLVGAQSGDITGALNTLSEYFGISISLRASQDAIIHKFIKFALTSFGKRLSVPVINFEKAKEGAARTVDDPVLRDPPLHIWDGPQPGMYEQVDEQHRYIFSPTSGFIDSVILYTTNGEQKRRVVFGVEEVAGVTTACVRETSDWDGEKFVPLSGRSLRSYVDGNGKIHAISPQDKNLYITPAGKVIELKKHRLFRRAFHGEYRGRLVGFSPRQPFIFETAFGRAPLAPERADVLIAQDGTVFNFQDKELRRIGEIIADEKILVSTPVQVVVIQHEFFSATSDGTRFDILHPFIQRALALSEHIIVGSHPLIKNQVPELVDMNGSTAGEEQLRVVERAGVVLGLVLRAVRSCEQPEMLSALLSLEKESEDKLWHAVANLENLVGYEPHTLVDRAAVRQFVEAVATHPTRGISDLWSAAKPRYVEQKS